MTISCVFCDNQKSKACMQKKKAILKSIKSYKQLSYEYENALIKQAAACGDYQETIGEVKGGND